MDGWCNIHYSDFSIRKALLECESLHSSVACDLEHTHIYMCIYMNHMVKYIYICNVCVCVYLHTNICVCVCICMFFCIVGKEIVYVCVCVY